MYLRWVVAEIDPDSHRRLGVFHAAADLREGPSIHPKDKAHLEELRDWFNEHLEKPDRFTASKPPYYRKQPKALSWFKDTAHDHIGKVRAMTKIVEQYGIAVTVLRAERVGYVVYEDGFQIVAEPFSETIC
jgi:hypothetical protein